MDNLIISFNAVAPMFLMIAVGALCRKARMIPADMVARLNHLVFVILTPTLLFSNIYQTAVAGGSVRPFLLIYAAGATLALFVLVYVIARRLVPDRRKQGALIQGIFRSNYVLLGLPIVLSLFPPEEAGVTSLVAAVMVPLFNVLAVFTLETCRGGRIHWGKVVRGIAKNPLIIGTVMGLVLWAAGLRLPTFLDKTVSSLAGCATPMALVALGASFELSSFRENRRYLTWACLGRLVIIPGIALPVAILLGFRNVELAALMAVFAAPTAVSSFTMAQQMDSDGPLAAEIVVATSGLSCLTIFLWTFGLKQLGLM